MDFLMLRVTPKGLREGADLDNLKLADIRGTYQLGALADVVVVDTGKTRTVGEGDDAADQAVEVELKNIGGITDEDAVHVVIFDGIALRAPEGLPPRPLARAQAMKKAITKAKRKERHGEG